MPQGGGAGKSTAAQHSQSLEVWFAHIPGLKVVLPSTPYDAKGLLKAAIRDDNPVIFLEHKFLYAFRGPVPSADYALPLGKCDVKRAGRDVTVVASGYMVWHAMLAARQLASRGHRRRGGRRADDQPARRGDDRRVGAQDRPRASSSPRRCRSYGPTGEWAMVAMEQAFDYLQAPIVRVTGRNSPVPFANSIEDGQWPTTADVVAAIADVTMASSGGRTRMAVEVFLPKMTDHMDAGEIVRWLVSEGATVSEHQPILEMMTDKVVAEVEAPASGVLTGIRAGRRAGRHRRGGLDDRVRRGAGRGGADAATTRPDHSLRRPPLPTRPTRWGRGERGSVAVARPRRGGGREPRCARPGPGNASRSRCRPRAWSRPRARSRSGPNGRVSEADVRAYATSSTPFPAGTGTRGMESPSLAAKGDRGRGLFPLPTST